jgi:tetratricopeptide (TPR) repeat protein
MLTEAVEVLSSSADRFVTRHTPYWHLVFLHTRLGDGPKAVAAGERAAELGKGNADAEWVLGFAQLTAGKLDAAAVTALGFARKHPSDPRGADLLAQIAVAKPSQEAPAEVRGLLHAGLADLYQGEHARAAAAFRRVAELDGKLACGHLNLGLARYKLGDWNGATAALTTAAELDPAVAGQVKGMLARVETARKQTPREVLPPPRRAEGN